MPKTELTQELVRKRFYYNTSTGELFHRTRPRGGVAKAEWRDPVGTPNGNGYLMVKIDGRVHYLHRIAFLYVVGWIPEEVDHINGDRLDNRWINLRPASSKVNGRNRQRPCTNTSGCTGVYWDKRRARWRAQIQVNDRHVFLGYYKNKGDAIDARKAAEIELGFHPNHGRDPVISRSSP